MEFEALLVSVGDNGLYQMALFSLAGMLAFISVDSFAINFLAGKMDHRCAIPSSVSPQSWNSSHESEPLYICYYPADQFTNWTDSDYTTDVYNQSVVSDSQSSSSSSLLSSIKCKSWIYDKSLFASTIQSEVSPVVG